MSYAAAGPSRPYVHTRSPANGEMAMPVPYRNGTGLPPLPPDLPPKMDYSAASPSPVDSGRGISPGGSMQAQYSHGQNQSNGARLGSTDTGQGANGAGIGHGNGEDPTKRNPLVDLMDSEKVYVEQLGLVIRRVAAAWSRKDFPPPKLDAMFRCIEAVFRANRSFGNKLREIGPNPSSPKALGDLLMRWIDDLEPAYHKYASAYLGGFDSYAGVTRNALLPDILADISSSNPPPAPLEQWTLDALFLLPFGRLRYYRKLYARLLRSTKEGRSDHRLLVTANQRLESLVERVEGRLDMDVSDGEVSSPDSPNDPNGSAQQRGASAAIVAAVQRTSTSTTSSAPSRGQTMNVGHASGTSSGSGSGSQGERSREPSWAEAEKERERERQSRASSGMGSSQGSKTDFSPFSSRVEDRNSGTSAATSVHQSPQRQPTGDTITGINKSAPALPLSDLEYRIDTDRAIDLFSMNPKKCKLQMNPASLPYTRTLRSSHDVSLTFTPTSTGQTVQHRRAHVFILTDLFLVAEWMDAADKAAKMQVIMKEQPERVGQGGPMPEMWLCYPPLAGRHLVVGEGQQANVLNLTVMRKETFVIHAESEIARDQIVKDITECIDFASNLSRQNTNNTPTIVTSPTDARSMSSLSDLRSQESTFPPLRYPSPFSAQSSPSASPRLPDEYDALNPSRAQSPPQAQPPHTLHGGALASQMTQLSLQPGETVQWNRRPSVPNVQYQGLPPGAGPSAYGQGVPISGRGPPSLGSGHPSSDSIHSGAFGGGGGTLPPRSASLRMRQASLGVLPPQPGSLPGQGPPQLPALPFDPGNPRGNNNNVYSSGSIPRSPSGRSVASNPRSDGEHSAHAHGAQLPPVPQIRAPSAPGQMSMGTGPGSHLSDPMAGAHALHHGPSRSRSADPLRPPLDPAFQRPPLHLNTQLPPLPGQGPGAGARKPGPGLGIDPLAPPRRPNPDGLVAIQSPSARFSSFPMREDDASSLPGSGPNSNHPSPPASPVEDEAEFSALTGPAVISAQMKCKVFLQQSHQQWKSLGGAKLKLYVQKDRNVKQLVVESDAGKAGQNMLISTIVLTDGVERVAKTGVAVEISDRGQRTGIIYMLQLRNESSAAGLFGSLLKGSDRDPAR